VIDTWFSPTALYINGRASVTIQLAEIDVTENFLKFEQEGLLGGTTDILASNP